jgi:hypothetical protein
MFQIPILGSMLKLHAHAQVWLLALLHLVIYLGLVNDKFCLVLYRR